uniref:Uncharacterized protein n=1 Tax=viral metagenome TaxID=1070528 RepID=A0A6M3JN74_9ZZZZ
MRPMRTKIYVHIWDVLSENIGQPVKNQVKRDMMDFVRDKLRQV